jgi:hypothetical protein
MTRLGNTTAAATALVAAAVFLLPAAARPSVALGALDTTSPGGSVGGVRNPASGTLELRLYAYDVGSGLANAGASLDGGASAFVRLGSGACPERPAPGSEPPPGAECPESVSGVPLSLDTRSVADGARRLRVRVTDGAGNTATLVDQEIVVRNAVTPGGTQATVSVGVTSQSIGSPLEEGGGSRPSPPGKGVGCRRPKLKMRLARKPLWRTLPKHVPVLWFGRRYPFKGKLTCLAPSRKRVAAPKGTRVGVYYRVWHRSFKRPRGPVRYIRLRKIKVGKKGRLKVSLGFRSGRTILFRYLALDGEIAKAKLRLAVPPKSRRPPWGPRR